MIRGKRELGFIKDNMSRGNDASRLKIKTSVASMIRRIAEERAWRGSGAELVWCCSGLIGKTKAPENSQVIIGGGRTKKKFVGGGATTCATRPTIDQVSGCREGLNLVLGW